MHEATATVIENHHIIDDYYLIKLEDKAIARESKPGNFVMLAARSSHDPLLKRPFGILDAAPPVFSIYYQVVGRGTRMISQLREGDSVAVIGPLGNEFPTRTNSKILLIAGGRGIAPLFFAAKAYTESNNVDLIYGARSKNDLNLLEELAALSFRKIFLFTEDGSEGERGDVTTRLREIISKQEIQTTIACGPDAMFKSIYQTIGPDTENFVSLESLMGCGFGICQSCVVKSVSGGYKKVCADGPIFRLEEIAW
jgi:dihydroorotate dehydrogenase electron transfer subunit